MAMYEKLRSTREKHMDSPLSHLGLLISIIVPDHTYDLPDAVKSNGTEKSVNIRPSDVTNETNLKISWKHLIYHIFNYK